jgi:hypothetical protein
MTFSFGDPDDVAEVERLVVLGEQLGDQLATAGHADLVEDGLHVVADRMGREEQLLGDVGGAGAAGDQAVICCSRPVRS